MIQPIEYFKKISTIPRGSGNEKAIADYIEAIAKENGLFCLRDSCSNVFVRRNASVGYGNAPAILFAAHTDMVCEKTPASAHNFLTDPLDLREKDGYIYAEGTTLGADDGAGVAAMLSLMTDPDIIAPETEYLFTSSEGTGMDGAFGFDYSTVHAEKIINLDCGVECHACVGSAAGQKFEMKMPFDRTRKSGKSVRITVSGLAGGHSGGEIDSGNRSAIKILCELLTEIYNGYPFNLISICGGGKSNVIPTEAEAVVSFCGTDEEKTAKAVTAEFEKATRTVLFSADRKGFKVRFNRLKEAESAEISEMMTLKSTSRALSLLTVIPQGVLSRLPDSRSVMSSNNLGILSTKENYISLDLHPRYGSAREAKVTENTVHRIAHTFDAELVLSGAYPGWEYRSSSPLQSLYADACQHFYGKTPSFSAVHAGLECGIFYERLAALGKSPDIISICPNLYDIYSVAERMEIASLDRLYSVLKIMLGSVK